MNMEITPEIQQRLEQLNEKYSALGQDLLSYLDGLLYADTVKYWDYIEVDTLLSLQKPRTNFPDEVIFIMSHQVTELYFKLALNEFEQLSAQKDITPKFFSNHVTRMNRWIDALIKSFYIVILVVDRDQFMKFIISLLPSI